MGLMSAITGNATEVSESKIQETGLELLTH